MNQVVFKIAEKKDAPVIFSMLQKMASDMGVAEKFKGSLNSIEEAGFSSRPAFECIIAWEGGAAVGFILYFRAYSTWTARSGIFIQDIFVPKNMRGTGLAAQLLASAIDKSKTDYDAAYIDLAVHDTNDRAFAFYEKLGFIKIQGETIMKLSGEALLKAQGE